MLSDEEKQKIYEEEKERLEARDKIKNEKEKEKNKGSCGGAIGCLAIFIIIILFSILTNNNETNKSAGTHSSSVNSYPVPGTPLPSTISHEVLNFDDLGWKGKRQYWQLLVPEGTKKEDVIRLAEEYYRRASDGTDPSFSFGVDIYESRMEYEIDQGFVICSYHKNSQLRYTDRNILYKPTIEDLKIHESRKKLFGSGLSDEECHKKIAREFKKTPKQIKESLNKTGFWMWGTQP